MTQRFGSSKVLGQSLGGPSRRVMRALPPCPTSGAAQAAPAFPIPLRAPLTASAAGAARIPPRFSRAAPVPGAAVPA